MAQEAWKERGALRKRVLSLLEEHDCEEAHSLYQKHCREWWPRNEYETHVSRAKEREALRKEREALRKRVLSLLEKFDYEGAHSLYHRRCRMWWSHNDYSACVSRVQEREPLALRKEREALKKEVLFLLEKFDYEGAHSLYQERCREWWHRSEYETHVSQAKKHEALALGKEREALRKRVLSLLKKFDYEGAHSLYQERCREWWPRNEYDVHASRAKEREALALRQEREALQKRILSFLREFDYEGADALYKGHCQEWWPRSEYDAHTSRAKEEQAREEQHAAMLHEIRRRFQSNFLAADRYFRESCAEIITEQKFESDKVRFVKNWVEANTPSKNGSKQLPDDEQIAAIAAVHGHVQVVARAGSGKTATLVNRALFLLKHCRIPPGEILILAFNRKAALEVRRRLLGLMERSAESSISAEIDRRNKDSRKRKRISRNDINDIEEGAVDTIAARLNITLPHVMTFHALAYAIVHPEESLLYDRAEGESQELSRTVQRVIDDHLQVPEFREKIRELMMAHFREDWARIVEGRYGQSKEELLQFRRSLPLESIGGQYVKSYGEKLIADFLFEHKIKHKYEHSHWWNGINYRPDFTIFVTWKSGIIIEYFGLKGDPDYDEMSERKRRYWKDKAGWTLVEFAPQDIARNGAASFLQDLKSRLQDQGVPCARLSEDEIWNRVRDRAIDRFTKAVVGFVVRCRKQSLSSIDLRGRINGYSPLSPVERIFLDLAHSLYVAYLSRLSATGEDDFDGLMQRAAEAVGDGATKFQRKSGGGDLASLRYVCIDEFQDFSDLFYKLLVAIRKINPELELFCVGDDWQAINGFAGSDLRFFKNFERYIGESRRLYISKNYRSENSIVAVGNALMSGLGRPASENKRASGRVLVSDLNEFEPSLIEKERHRSDIITPAVLRLANDALEADMEVVMLCRQNRLPRFGDYQHQASGNGRGLDKYLGLIRSFFPNDRKERISISTVHKYKGLEKPMVIVLDLVDGRYPLIHPDWFFQEFLVTVRRKLWRRNAGSCTWR